MKRNATLLPALFLALGLVVTGCGGGDDTPASSDSPTATPSAISKTDFTDQANKICASGNVAIDAAITALGDGPTQDEIVAFFTDTLVPSTQAEIDAISALGAPEGDEDEIAALLESVQTAIDTVSADPAAAAESTDSPFAEANDLALAYGLTDCAG